MKSCCRYGVLYGIALTLFADEEEFVPLFNGKDMSGRANVNCAEQ